MKGACCVQKQGSNWYMVQCKVGEHCTNYAHSVLNYFLVTVH